MNLGPSIAPLSLAQAQGAAVEHTLRSLDVVLGIAVFVTVAVTLWIVYQIRASGRRMWTVDVACALRARDLDALDRLAADTKRRSWIPALGDLIDELRQVLRLEGDRTCAALQKARYERERFMQGPVAQLIVDVDRRITACNDEACVLLGRVPSDLVGRRTDEVVRVPVTSDPRFEWLVEAFGARSGDVEVRQLDGPDGRSGPVLCVHQVVEHGPDERSEMSCALIDLRSVRTPSNAPPSEAASDDALGRLAAGVAREFNDRLTTVLWNSSMLRDHSSATSETRRGLAEIERAVEEARTLSKRLLAFSRPDTMSSRVVDLDAAVRVAERRIAEIAGPRIEVQYCLESGGTGVLATAGQIEEILEHLVENSARAMDRRGRIEIATHVVQHDTEASLVRLLVSDEGNGMTPAQRRRAFDPFYTTKPAGGLGLGLSLVRHLVEQNGGGIHLSRSSAGGLAVEITFPAQNRSSLRPAPRPIPAADALPAIVGDQRTICVVDDDGPVRNVIATVLRMDGHRVLEAAGGEEAIELVVAQREPVDLLILDVNMPGMGGEELHERLRRTHPSIEVLYMSGYVDREAFYSGRGADERFIQKPFTQSELRAKVVEILTSEERAPRRRVLVVDDERSTREALSRLLEALDVDPVVAETEAEALEALARQHVDAVIANLGEESSNVRRTGEAIQRKYPTVRVISTSMRTANDRTLDVSDLELALEEAFASS